MRVATAAVAAMAVLLSVSGCSKDEPVAAPSASTTIAAPGVTTSSTAGGETTAPSTSAGGSPTTTAPSGGAPAATATPGPAATAFLDAGNAICKTMAADTAAVSARHPNSESQTPADVKAVLDESAAVIAGGVQKLRQLSPPAADKAAVDKMIGDLEKVGVLAPQIGTAMVAGNTAEIERLSTELGTIGDATNKAFTAYGLTECATASP